MLKTVYIECLLCTRLWEDVISNFNFLCKLYKFQLYVLFGNYKEVIVHSCLIQKAPLLSLQTLTSQLISNKEKTKKFSSTLLAVVAAPLLKSAVAQDPTLKQSVFDHTWAQTQRVVNISSPLTYRVY